METNNHINNITDDLDSKGIKLRYIEDAGSFYTFELTNGNTTFYLGIEYSWGVYKYYEVEQKMKYVKKGE